MIQEALDTLNGNTFGFHYLFDKNIRCLFLHTPDRLRCDGCDLRVVFSYNGATEHAKRAQRSPIAKENGNLPMPENLVMTLA